MLTRLHVRGYKALRDVSITFEPLTVIVGPNGCGKTSVLEALATVRTYAAGGSQTSSITRHPFSEIVSGGPDQPEEIEITSWADPGPGKWEPSEIGVELRYLAGQQDAGLGSVVVRPLDPLVNPDALDAGFDGIRRLILGSDAVARSSYLPEPVPRMKDDGTGVATVLSWLQGERDDRFAEIEQRLRQFVPEVRRIRTRRVPIRALESADVKVGQDDDGNDVFEKRSYQREEIGHQVVIDYEHAQGVAAPHASEGTLLLLGLLTAIHTSEASVLLLDDIERGLHPKSQQQLVGYLQELTKQGTQIIATSHSPYLLLHLEYEQVRAMTLDGAAGSRIGKLSEHPQFEQWKEEMTPSEFWTVFGEEWLRERTGRG
ncbi:MAG: ATP-binding protein [Nannocystaceae bacterium]